MLVSRKHLIRYYGIFLIAFVLWAFIPVATIWLLFSLYQTDARSAIALGVIFLTFFLPITLVVISKIYGEFRKYASAIKMTADEIIFDTAIYPLSEIQFISLTGKPPLGKHKVMHEEAATIKFRNGDLKYIFDNIHTNAWKLKMALEQIIIRQVPIQVAKIEQVKDGEVSLKDSKKFAGSQWSTREGILLWGAIGLFTLLGISGDSEAGWLFIIPINTLWYFIFGYRLNFFQMTKSKHLVVLNHALPFRQHEIRLSDIREVVFEYRFRGPIVLRIITKDFRSKLYPAATLRTQHWFDLKIALEEHGIFVRNECVEDFDWDLKTIEKTSYEKPSH